MKQGGAISSEPWLLSDGSKILNERRHIDAFRKDEHFTMYAEKSVGLRIFAGSEKGETVLDPFFGSGTRGAGAKRLGGGGVYRHRTQSEILRKGVCPQRKRSEGIEV